MKLNTFSIVGCDPNSGIVGVAVSSKHLAVGALCPYARAQVGAVASQAWLNPWLGVNSLALLEEGVAPEDVVERALADDPAAEWRQLIVVDAQGRSAAFTGDNTDPWRGHRTGQDYAAAGNLLVSGETVDAMAATFEANEDQILPERLLRALEAGQAAGGDRRGRQAAALLVMNQLELPYVDLRVDDHPDPVTELRRLFELAREHVLELGERISSDRTPRGPDEIKERQRLMREKLGFDD